MSVIQNTEKRLGGGGPRLTAAVLYIHMLPRIKMQTLHPHGKQSIRSPSLVYWSSLVPNNVFNCKQQNEKLYLRDHVLFSLLKEWRCPVSGVLPLRAVVTHPLGVWAHSGKVPHVKQQYCFYFRNAWKKTPKAGWLNRFLSTRFPFKTNHTCGK